MSNEREGGLTNTARIDTLFGKWARATLTAELVVLLTFAIYVGVLWLPFENIDAGEEGYSTAVERRPTPTKTAAAGAAFALVPTLVVARGHTGGAARGVSRVILVLLHVVGAAAVVALIV